MDKYQLRKGLPWQAQDPRKGLRSFGLRVTGPMKDFKLVNENQMGILERSFRYQHGGQTGHTLRRSCTYNGALGHPWALLPRFPGFDSNSTTQGLGSLWCFHTSSHRLRPTLPSVVKTCPAALHRNPHSSPGTDKSSSQQQLLVRHPGQASSGPLCHGIWRHHTSCFKRHSSKRMGTNVSNSKAITLF